MPDTSRPDSRRRRPRGVGAIPRPARRRQPRAPGESALAVLLSERISAATQILSSAEFLVSRRDQRPGGLNDWSHMRHSFVSATPRLLPVFDRVSGERAESIIQAARVVAGASLFLPGSLTRHRAAANGFLAVSAWVLHPKHVFGSDGSDQLAFLVQSAAALARIGDSHRRREAGLVFLAGQAGLSYLASGAVKLASRSWRSGEALTGVLRTRTYGDRGLYSFLRAHPRLARAAAHAVLVAEVGFPLVLLLPTRLALGAIAGMTVFHLLNARYMGLARFVWAFLATYPAVIYVVTARASGRRA